MFINYHREIILATMLILSSMLTAKVKGNTINLKEFVITAEAPEANAPEAAAMQVEITDYFGKTYQAENLNFDLQPLPVGQYTVKVIKNGEEVNSVYVNSLNDNNSVITVEALDAKGNQVYESTKSAEMFDLEQLPAGSYVVNIYQGKNLINTKKINKA